MDRQTYNSCMKKYISGAGKTPEERRLSFCAGAKICTGKAKDVKEAVQICQSQPPKEPKPRANRGGKCVIDPDALANCVMSSIGETFSAQTLSKALAGCTGQKKKSGKVRVSELSPEHREALEAIASLRMDMGT